MLRSRMRNFAIVVALAMIFMINTIDTAFSPLVRIEAKSVGSSTNTSRLVDSLQSDSGFSSHSQGDKKLANTYGDLWGFIDSDSRTSFDSIEKRDAFGVDEDSMQLVVGVDNSKAAAYSGIVDAIISNQGSVVNTVSMKGEITAVVADVPLKAVSAFKESIQRGGLARYIEPRMKFQVQFTPNDPDWGLQWGPQKIEADDAWNTTIGSHSVLVAVIDTGIDYDHPDLAANYVALGYDWVNDDPYPMDDHGHGTHCAGIIAGVINNGLGIAGVANVSIMAEKGLDQYGSGSDVDLAKCIIDAVDKGADILSNSWGGYGESELIYDAVKYAYDNGVVVVAAAGNDGWSTKPVPAGYDEIEAVTATDQYDNPAFFTNFGDWVEVAAPGVSIYSTIWDDSYAYGDGTSMACPHASAVAALIWSRFPNASRDWVRAQLRFSADDLGSPGFDEYYGYGRINAKNAVEQVPPSHDLLIFESKRPRHIQPGDVASLNVTVLNFGENDELNLAVQLLVNGYLTDSKVVSYLSKGASATVSLSWNPLTEAIYNVTLYVVPVSGETAIENNVKTEMVQVSYPLGLVLFDQTRCDPISYYSLWVTNLTDRGYIVDTCADGPITPATLVGYDIFVIPQAYNSYSSTELSAIQDFVLGGGGLLVIGDYDAWIYTSLTSFADIAWGSYYGWYGPTSDITPHDVTEGVSSAYFGVPYTELFVNASAEDLIRGGGHIMLAVSEADAGRVICIADEDTINDYAIYQEDNFRLANNMIDWLLGVKYQHELVARLQAPSYLEPGEASTLNASVLNRGSSNETSVEIRLLINSVVVKSETVPLLVNSTKHTMSYLWTPSLGTYNVTVYVPPVLEENVTLNNQATKFVEVRYPLINPLPGQYANYVLKTYDSSGKLVGSEGYWNITYDYYVEPHKIQISMWQKAPDGTVFTGWLIVNTMNRLVEVGVWAGLWFPGWIETGIGIGSAINILDGTAIVNGTKLLVVAPRIIDCWEIPYWYYGFPYSFFHDKVSGLWIGMDSVNPATRERGEMRLIDTNVPIGTQYTHDLGVILDAPSYLQPSDTAVLEATVYNLGLSSEANVEIHLIINGTDVASEVIGVLASGASYTLNHSWKPSIVGSYNITAYAPAVTGETMAANNVYWQTVKVEYAPKILAYVGYTDYVEEYQHTLSAIESTFGPNYELSELWDETQIDSLLPGKDILLIPEQEYTSSSTLENIGSEWSETLQEFLKHGGIIIVCDYNGGWGGTYAILTGAGLMSIERANDRTWTNLHLVDPEDPLADGVASSFFGPSGTLSFVTQEENVVVDDGTYPAVIHKEVGRGHIALLGFDFYMAYIDPSKILGNAVNLATFISVSVNPLCGSPGTEVVVSGTKVTANGTVSIYWDSMLMGNVTASSEGDFTYLLTVPSNASIGVHEIKVVDAVTGRAASQFFKVLLISLSPSEGSVGTKVTVKGAGFTSESQATITFNDLLIGYALVDGFGNFTFTFNVPVSSAESQLVKAHDVGGGASAVFTVVDVTPLDVQVDVGTMHFRGEIAEFYALTVFKGKAVNATITSAVLYKPDGTTEVLTAQQIATGLFKLPYSIAGNASAGTYTLVVSANYSAATVKAEGTSFRCFLISSTLTSMNAMVQEIQGDIATIVIPNLGTIKANFTEINARIVSLNNTTADIKTDIGTIRANLDDIKLKVIAINGTTATIQTLLGTMTGTITSIKDNVATILVPGIGQIQTDISDLAKDTQGSLLPMQYVVVALSLIAAIGAISATVLLLRRKKTPETE